MKYEAICQAKLQRPFKLLNQTSAALNQMTLVIGISDKTRSISEWSLQREEKIEATSERTNWKL